MLSVEWRGDLDAVISDDIGWRVAGRVSDS